MLTYLSVKGITTSMPKHLLLGFHASAALAVFLLVSCVSVQKTSYQDAPLAGTTFESEKASSTFYQAVLAEKFPAKGPNTTLTLFVPLPFSYYHRDRQSSNVMLNAALAQADTDKNGVITEDEANAFAAGLAAKREAAKKTDEKSTEPKAGLVSDDGIVGAGLVATDHPKG
jgi:hypothetical protein